MPISSVAIQGRQYRPVKGAGKKRTQKRVAPVVIYTKGGCPWCTKAKDKLKARGVPFKEVDVQKGLMGAPVTLPDGRTSYTVPQIYLPVGGFDAMDSWLPKPKQ